MIHWNSSTSSSNDNDDVVADTGDDDNNDNDDDDDVMKSLKKFSNFISWIIFYEKNFSSMFFENRLLFNFNILAKLFCLHFNTGGSCLRSSFVFEIGTKRKRKLLFNHI